MIRWYRDLYMDEAVEKNPEKCKKKVMRRRPWKKNYYALMLAQNPQDLFEIVGTREFFFRRFGYLDLYIVGLASDYDGAVKMLCQILSQFYAEPEKSAQSPRDIFDKDDFE